MASKRCTHPLLTFIAAALFGSAATAQPPPAPAVIFDAPVSGPACLIESDFTSNGFRNFELVVLQGSDLVHYWRANDAPETPWRKGDVITTRAIAPGCVVQSDFVTEGHGNLEVVVPEVGGTLVHYWHSSGSLPSAWQRAGNITTGVTGSACLITSDFLSAGHRNLELVVQKGDQLWHYWHSANASDDNWPGELVTTGVTRLGTGCFLQSDYQANGHRNFELVVQKDTQLWHYWHWWGLPAGQWPGAPVVSGVTAPGCLIESDFKANNIGNFEVVVQQGSAIWHHWTYDGLAGDWPGQQLPVPGVAGPPCLIQSSTFRAGNHGNFEVAVPAIVPAGSAGQRAELVHYFKINDPVGQPWRAAQTITFQGRSEKVCQLTGNLDWESGAATAARTQTYFGLGATDLGYPVEHEGNLFLLFGDTWPSDRPHPDDGRPDDAVGLTSRTLPPSRSACLDMIVNTAAPAAALTQPPTIVNATVSGIQQGYFNVPSGGVSVNGNLYAFFWTHHCEHPTALPPARTQPLSRPRPGASCPETDTQNSVGANLLARSLDGGRTFIPDSGAAWMPLGFVYATAVNSDLLSGLPADQKLGVFIFGVPRYRASIPYLAYAKPGDFAHPAFWKFFAGRDARGAPQWVPIQRWSNGTPPRWTPPGSPEIFDAASDNDRSVGEFSISWNQILRCWLMTYTTSLGQVVVRVAHAPWGPWSAATVVLSPAADGPDSDGAICRITGVSCGNQDTYNSGTGFYAPFVLDRYTTPVTSYPGIVAATLYYLVSPWNPYQTTLMRTTLTLPDTLEKVASH